MSRQKAPPSPAMPMKRRTEDGDLFGSSYKRSKGASQDVIPQRLITDNLNRASQLQIIGASSKGPIGSHRKSRSSPKDPLSRPVDYPPSDDRQYFRTFARTPSPLPDGSSPNLVECSRRASSIQSDASNLFERIMNEQRKLVVSLTQANSQYLFRKAAYDATDSELTRNQSHHIYFPTFVTSLEHDRDQTEADLRAASNERDRAGGRCENFEHEMSTVLPTLIRLCARIPMGPDSDTFDKLSLVMSDLSSFVNKCITKATTDRLEKSKVLRPTVSTPSNHDSPDTTESDTDNLDDLNARLRDVEERLEGQDYTTQSERLDRVMKKLQKQATSVSDPVMNLVSELVDSKVAAQMADAEKRFAAMLEERMKTFSAIAAPSPVVVGTPQKDKSDTVAMEDNIQISEDVTHAPSSELDQTKQTATAIRPKAATIERLGVDTTSILAVQSDIKRIDNSMTSMLAENERTALKLRADLDIRLFSMGKTNQQSLLKLSTATEEIQERLAPAQLNSWYDRVRALETLAKENGPDTTVQQMGELTTRIKKIEDSGVQFQNIGELMARVQKIEESNHQSNEELSLEIQKLLELTARCEKVEKLATYVQKIEDLAAYTHKLDGMINTSQEVNSQFRNHQLNEVKSLGARFIQSHDSLSTLLQRLTDHSAKLESDVSALRKQVESAESSQLTAQNKLQALERQTETLAAATAATAPPSQLARMMSSTPTPQIRSTTPFQLSADVYDKFELMIHRKTDDVRQEAKDRVEALKESISDLRRQVEDDIAARNRASQDRTSRAVVRQWPIFPNQALSTDGSSSGSPRIVAASTPTSGTSFPNVRTSPPGPMAMVSAPVVHPPTVQQRQQVQPTFHAQHPQQSQQNSPPVQYGPPHNQSVQPHSAAQQAHPINQIQYEINNLKAQMIQMKRDMAAVSTTHALAMSLESRMNSLSTEDLYNRIYQTVINELSRQPHTQKAEIDDIRINLARLTKAVHSYNIESASKDSKSAPNKLADSADSVPELVITMIRKQTSDIDKMNSLLVELQTKPLASVEPQTVTVDSKELDEKLVQINGRIDSFSHKQRSTTETLDVLYQSVEGTKKAMTLYSSKHSSLSSTVEELSTEMCKMRTDIHQAQQQLTTMRRESRGGPLKPGSISTTGPSLSDLERKVDETVEILAGQVDSVNMSLARLIYLESAIPPELEDVNLQLEFYMGNHQVLTKLVYDHLGMPLSDWDGVWQDFLATHKPEINVRDGSPTLSRSPQRVPSKLPAAHSASHLQSKSATAGPRGDLSNTNSLNGPMTKASIDPARDPRLRFLGNQTTANKANNGPNRIDTNSANSSTSSTKHQQQSYLPTTRPTPKTMTVEKSYAKEDEEDEDEDDDEVQRDSFRLSRSHSVGTSKRH